MSIHDDIKRAGGGATPVGTAIEKVKDVAREFATFIGSLDSEWGLVPYDPNGLAVGQHVVEQYFKVTNGPLSVSCNMWIKADDVKGSAKTLKIPMQAKIKGGGRIEILLAHDIVVSDHRESAYSTLAKRLKNA